MTAWLLLTLLIILSLVGIALAALQLPGTWLILLAAVGYDALHDWNRIGWKWLAALGVVALVAEALELLASAVVAKKAGASRRAAIGALVGGLAGMLLFSIPVPVIGTIIGGLVGCFVGALAMELTVRGDISTGTKVGIFATLGRIAGMLLKTAAAMTMAGAGVSLAVLHF
jgi:uncharacterized protein YqgC (DUF456 family)